MTPRRPRIALIAHRGASAIAPEGTRAAIRGAIRAGAQMIELDVQMTRDGRLVVFHDDRLERTTNGSGWLRGLSYAQVARLDAGSWFHPRFAGEQVLLVSQAIRLIPERMRINLELKRTSRRQALLQGVARTLRWTRSTRRILVSSFDAKLLKPLSRRVACALLCRRRPERSLEQAVRLGCAAWHPHVSLTTPARIRRAHRAGLQVNVWVVDDPATARRLIQWGADGMFTNDPGRLRGMVG
ncbi:MAG: glycerophosphoryl diester phosphodiesterase [Candidatus Omnitrophica bacterium]|nr:glycerophosphoryl diester phosphodiesterase [Candidatus Omnitrophota bacterium]